MLVIKNEYGFSAYCSNEYNGVKTHCYMPVTFKKGIEPSEDKVNINATSFFMSCYTNKDGKVVPKMVITNYIIVKAEDEFNKVAEKVEKRIESKKSLEISPEELPFY